MTKRKNKKSTRIENNYALIMAIRNNDIENVEKLLKIPSVNPTIFNNECIRLASFNGFTQIVKLLLAWIGPNRQTVDPIMTVGNSYTCLLSAIINSHIEIIKMLLAWQGLNGEYINPADDNMSIILAISNNNLEITNILLEWRGLNGEFIDLTVENNLPIVLPIKNGYNDIILSLLNWTGPNGEYIDMSIFNIFYLAILNNRVETLQILLEWRGRNGEYVDPSMESNWAITNSSMAGYTEIVEMLLKWVGPNGERVNPTDYDNSAIKWASKNGYKRTVKMLLDWKNVNNIAIDYTVLIVCIREASVNNFNNIVEMILDDNRIKSNITCNDLELLHREKYIQPYLINTLKCFVLDREKIKCNNIRDPIEQKESLIAINRARIELNCPSLRRDMDIINMKLVMKTGNIGEKIPTELFSSISKYL
jgi:ankyrin repeat protein